MAPGTSANHTVVLKHTGILPIPFTNQLRIVAEGAIAPFVTITQSKFPVVFKRGNEVTVPITISIPVNTPAGEIKGSLVLKRILPNGKVMEVWRADALPAELTFSFIPLPPDPGKAGKATIEGIDIGGGNNREPNGVRDDIDRYIGFTFPASEKRRIAMTQYTRENQKLLMDFLGTASDPAEQKLITRANAEERRKSSTCLYYILGDATKSDLEKAFVVQSNLRAQFLNTIERQQVYLEADELLGGTVWGDPGDPKTLCKEFGLDPNVISN